MGKKLSPQYDCSMLLFVTYFNAIHMLFKNGECRNTDIKWANPHEKTKHEKMSMVVVANTVV